MWEGSTRFCQCRNHLVNAALLDHFLTSCHVTSHFLSLKRFLLLEDGEFAYSLSTQLFHKVSNSLSLPFFSNNCLSAVEECRRGFNDITCIPEPPPSISSRLQSPWQLTKC